MMAIGAGALTCRSALALASACGVGTYSLSSFQPARSYGPLMGTMPRTAERGTFI